MNIDVHVSLSMSPFLLGMDFEIEVLRGVVTRGTHRLLSQIKPQTAGDGSCWLANIYSSLF